MPVWCVNKQQLTNSSLYQFNKARMCQCCVQSLPLLQPCGPKNLLMRVKICQSHRETYFGTIPNNANHCTIIILIMNLRCFTKKTIEQEKTIILEQRVLKTLNPKRMNAVVLLTFCLAGIKFIKSIYVPKNASIPGHVSRAWSGASEVRSVRNIVRVQSGF